MLGASIAFFRKKMGLTQEQLAQKLDVTNQAVSKWETDQCCPDTLLLPKIADVFGITIDALFGRENARPEAGASNLPWEDDDAFHVVLYHGHTLIGAQPEHADLTFTYEGPAKDVHCEINLSCGDVAGNVNAGGSVECGAVGGGLTAGSYVECAGVDGAVNAGGYVECAGVEGNVHAGGYIECADVSGSVYAGSYVECSDVGKDVNAGSYVECGDVGGDVNATDHVECGSVKGEGEGFSFGKLFGFGKK